MSMPRLSTVPVLLAVLLLSACAAGGHNGPKNTITVDSQPQGAQVHAGERALGLLRALGAKQGQILASRHTVYGALGMRFYLSFGSRIGCANAGGQSREKPRPPPLPRAILC